MEVPVKPDDALDAEEFRHVLDIMQRMPERTRKVVELRKIEGMEQHEIAARLGISMEEVEAEIANAVRFMADNSEIPDGN